MCRKSGHEIKLEVNLWIYIIYKNKKRKKIEKFWDTVEGISNETEENTICKPVRRRYQ